MRHGGQISPLLPFQAAADEFVFVLAISMCTRSRHDFKRKAIRTVSPLRKDYLLKLGPHGSTVPRMTERMAKPTALHCSETEEARKSECSLSLSVMATYGLLCSRMVAWKTVHFSYINLVSKFRREYETNGGFARLASLPYVSLWDDFVDPRC